MHSVLVVEKRGQLKSWTVLLAILSFSLSLVGTFIVRSGLLTSVHSFASDPSRGIFILGILLAAIGLPLILFALRGPQLSSENDANFMSRDIAIVINNIILIVATSIVILGTFYPLGLELVSNQRITVGPPYYKATFNPIMSFALIGMVIGPILMWRKGVLPHAKRVLITALIGAVMANIIGLSVLHNISPVAIGGLGLLGWLGFGMIADMQRHLKFHQPSELLTSLRSSGVAIWGMWLGHMGMAVFLLGALGDGLSRSEKTVRAMPGDVIQLSDRQYRFIEVQQNQGPNYSTITALLSLESLEGQKIATLAPEKRFYPAEKQTTTEASIRATFAGDDYAVLGDGDNNIGYSLRLYHKPLVSWIWGGAAIMAFGGIMGFIGRKPVKGKLTKDAGAM